MSPLGITASLRGALGEAHDAIEDLASAVRRLGERHAADHDVLHMSRTLGLKLDDATHALAVQGDRLGRALADVEPDPKRTGGPLAGVRETVSELLGSRPPAGALLLADLRRFLARASDASVTCVILAQGAQAAQDVELLSAVTAAHDAVLRTHRWALTRLKTTAPQVLTGP
jgi:hypothetical protein